MREAGVGDTKCAIFLRNPAVQRRSSPDSQPPPAGGSGEGFRVGLILLPVDPGAAVPERLGGRLSVHAAALAPPCGVVAHRLGIKHRLHRLDGLEPDPASLAPEGALRRVRCSRSIMPFACGLQAFIPGNTPHNETGTSDTFARLEVSVRAAMGTRPCAPPPGHGGTAGAHRPPAG